MKKLEDLHSESARRLATLLSYNIGLSEKDLRQVRNEPKEWLSKMLYGDEKEVFSSLPLYEADISSDNIESLIKSNLEDEAWILKMDTGCTSGHEGIPQKGRYHAILDLGNDDLVWINATVGDYMELMMISKVEFHSKDNRNNLTLSSLKDQLYYSLNSALMQTEFHGQELSGEDVIGIFNEVASRYPEIESIMNAQKIKASIEGEKKPSVIRRKKL